MMAEDAQAIIDAIRDLGGHAIIGGTKEDALSLAVLPSGRTITDLQPFLDALRDAPRRIKASAKATTVDSFVDYLNRFKTPDSAIFAADDATNPALTAIVDFHGQGDKAAPRFGVHRVSYHFPISDQVKAWSAISGKALGHEEMATFIAEHQFDIANPPLDWMQVEPDKLALILHLLNLGDDSGTLDDAAADEPADDDGDERYIPRSAIYKLRKIRFGSAQRLIQLARTVELAVNAKAVEGYNPKSGERTVTFTEEHETRDGQGRKVSVPDAFLLRAPVWEGETPQLIPVRLQYRRVGGAVKWFLTLVEWRRVIRFAVKTEAERAQKATALPLFYGQPGG
jgi:hypothetical protein